MSDTPKVAPSADDPLALAPLFEGGGEPWMPLLKPTIESLPNAATFIGPSREKSIVPVRELTFQALKPNPPAGWKVVIFGQNPYPRVESATGIAMFDNTFSEWKDKKFGVVTSIRCIIKAASMHKHGIEKSSSTAKIRTLLAKERIVAPPEWFQAMLTQGVLLLNAALTASSDDALSTSQHTSFWRPVIDKIVEEILKAKASAQDAHKGVVFVWWGSHARALRGRVEKIAHKYPGARVVHVDHCNPAAMGDAFCDNDPFGAINAALESLDMASIDWLPAAGWNEGHEAHKETAGRMGDFITKTMELHRFYLDRLQGVGEEKMEELAAIRGILDAPLLGFGDAIGPVAKLLAGLEPLIKRSHDFARKAREQSATGRLDEHEIAALYLYTTESRFYRALNAALRDRDRKKATPYFAYLRLFFSAVSKLPPHKESLYRSVAADLRAQYPKGKTITWWGVSSCTPKLSVARGFLGSSGRRMLFEVVPSSAVGIKSYSAFTGEEEYVLAPGTQLEVADVKHEPSGLSTVKLVELEGQRLVS